MKKCNKNNYVLFDLLNRVDTAVIDKDAELLIRRFLDFLWISKDGYFPNNNRDIYRAIGKGFGFTRFRVLWELNKNENPVKVLFDISEDGELIYCQAMIDIKERYAVISKKRSTAGRKGGRPKQKPAPAPVPNTPDEKGTISGDPGRRSGAVSKGGFFDEIKRMNSDSGLSEPARRRLKGDK